MSARWSTALLGGALLLALSNQMLGRACYDAAPGIDSPSRVVGDFASARHEVDVYLSCVDSLAVRPLAAPPSPPVVAGAESVEQMPVQVYRRACGDRLGTSAFGDYQRRCGARQEEGGQGGRQAEAHHERGAAQGGRRADAQVLGIPPGGQGAGAGGAGVTARRTRCRLAAARRARPDRRRRSRIRTENRGSDPTAARRQRPSVVRLSNCFRTRQGTAPRMP